MGVTRYIGDRFFGTSSDIKPAGNLSDGAEFIEGDTLNTYIFITASGGWVLETSGGSGSSSVTGNFLTSGDISKNIILCAGFTPSSIGDDVAEFPVPFDSDGITPIDFKINRATFRLQTAGGSPSLSLQKSSGISSFSSTTITTLTMPNDAYETYQTGDIGQTTSNDKLRFSVNNLGSALNWTFEIQMTPGLVPVLAMEQGLDMPLDEAIYEPISNKIYGVRGQWIYKFNATTAANESQFRYQSRVLGTASIMSFSGNLYVTPDTDRFQAGGGPSGGFIYPYYNTGLNGSWSSPDKNIYVVNSGLSTTTPMTGYKLGASINQAFRVMAAITGISGVATGIVLGRNDGIGIAGFQNNFMFHNSGDLNLFEFGFTDSNDQLLYDATNSVLWANHASNHFNEIAIYDLTSSGFAFEFGYGTFGNLTNGISYVELPDDLFPFGISFSPAANALYGVAGDSRLIRISGQQVVYNLRTNGTSASAVTYKVFDLGIAEINPVRLKACPYPYHPYSGKVLIPTWNTDQVIVWDCLTDTVSSVKSGFTAPIDIVFTPNSAFAVQNSPTGLKEIL